MRHWMVGIALLTGFGSTSEARAEIQAKEGLYEITMQSVMPGMPGMPPQTMRQCITRSDLNHPDKFVKSGGGGDDCTIQDLKQETNQLAFKISCPKEKVTGKGEYRFSGDNYTGTMEMTMPNPGGPAMNMTVKTSAKWVGPCK
ncbi:MAG: DUF3617 domain-containing protein [Magnetococcales bacterium]|nr:DUF3617 domain-containing protein [Magnetococcales bacterium]